MIASAPPFPIAPGYSARIISASKQTWGAGGHWTGTLYCDMNFTSVPANSMEFVSGMAGGKTRLFHNKVARAGPPVCDSPCSSRGMTRALLLSTSYCLSLQVTGQSFSPKANAWHHIAVTYTGNVGFPQMMQKVSLSSKGKVLSGLPADDAEGEPKSSSASRLWFTSLQSPLSTHTRPFDSLLVFFQLYVDGVLNNAFANRVLTISKSTPLYIGAFLNSDGSTVAVNGVSVTGY